MGVSLPTRGPARQRPTFRPQRVAEPSPEGTTLDLAAAVARASMALTMSAAKSSGDRYQEVQDLINYIDGASASQLADDVERGMFRRCADAQRRSGRPLQREFRQSSTRGRALALRASTPSRAATRSARLALRSVSTGTPSQARTALGHLIRSTPARSFISVQAG